MKAETTRKKATVKSTAQVYNGRIFNFVIEDLTLPNGRDTEVAFIRHPGSIAVVPLLDDNTVVMELQYRHPVGEYLLEIPAGTLEPGESPLNCAKRELMEETGYRAQEWVELGKIHMIPAYSDEEIHVFIAKGLTPAEQNLDPDEIIEVVTYPLAKAIQMIAAGKITDALTIASIQMAWFYINGRS
jgi:ADP-ribose pyrophosphatase